jgi:hypothetical protein
METKNPYEPPDLSIKPRRHFRVALSSTEIFTIGAVLAVLILLFAPGQRGFWILLVVQRVSESLSEYTPGVDYEHEFNNWDRALIYSMNLAALIAMEYYLGTPHILGDDS